jgi:hypothetical protein
VPAVGRDHAAISLAGGIDDGKNVVALVVATQADGHRVGDLTVFVLKEREERYRFIHVIAGVDPAIHADFRFDRICRSALSVEP